MSYYHLTQFAILPLGGGGESEEPLAVVSAVNPLRHTPTNIFGAAQRVVCWSGWFGEEAQKFDRDFRTWTREGWGALDAWCDGVLPHAAAAGATLCFRPHPRHVLADAQACVTFLKRREGQPVEVLLDAAGMLTAAMMARADDHLKRAMDALAGHPAVAGIVISNVVASKEDPELLESAPVGSGLLSRALMEMMGDAVREGKPRILVGGDVEGQAREIEGMGG